MELTVLGIDNITGLETPYGLLVPSRQQSDYVRQERRTSNLILILVFSYYLCCVGR